MSVSRAGLGVASAIVTVLLVSVPPAVEPAFGAGGITAWALDLVLAATLLSPVATTAFVVADWDARRRLGEGSVSAVPATVIAMSALVFVGSTAYQLALPEEEGVAIGLGLPFVACPVAMLVAALVHRSASQS